MENFNIICNSPEEFKILQEHLIFNLDYYWISSGKEILDYSDKVFPLIIKNYSDNLTINTKCLLYAKYINMKKLQGKTYQALQFIRKDKLKKLNEINL